MSFEIDRRSLNATVAQIERMIPRALAGTLNTVAFNQREALVRHTNEVFDRPKPGFVKGWRFERAKHTDGDAMSSSIVIAGWQAAILEFHVEGGIRRRGDIGSGPFDLMIDANSRDRYGNIRKNHLKKVARKAGQEKAERILLARRRRAARAAGASRSEMRKLRWITDSNNRAGTFFGTIKGVRGYWQRPARTKGAVKRRAGVRKWGYPNGNTPKLLVRFSDTARYQPRFRYREVVERTHRSFFTSQQFNRELQRALDRHS